MQVTGTHHVALVTGNFEELKRFYTETLGLPVVGGFPGRNIVFIQAGSTTIELIERAGFSPSAGSFDHLAFQVADIDATYAELKALGVPFHVDPKDFPDTNPAVRLAFFRDPDGNALELVQPLTDGYPQP